MVFNHPCFPCPDHDGPVHELGKKFYDDVSLFMSMD